MSDALESRVLLAITRNVVVGGTLDILPLSQIFPNTTTYQQMEVRATSIPHTQHGFMYRVDGTGTSEFIWGTGAPNAFNPSSNRINSGQGFRYKHTGTVPNVSETIPIRFRDTTGFNTLDDTLIINIVPPAGSPEITQHPQGLTSVATGGTATLSVVATGNAPLQFQWYRGYSPNTQFPIAGATSSSYTTPPLSPDPNGLDYVYWCRVFNGIGSVSSTTATVKVGQVPTANAGGPYNATEGGTVQLTGSGSDPNNGLYLVFEWDLDNDGLFNETGTGALNGNENVQNPVFSALNGPQAQTVRLKTTNDRGLSTISNATVNVANVAPSNIVANAPASIGQGQSFTLNGSFADPGTLDAHAVTINWGDGSPNTVLNLPAGQFTYSATKTYGVSYGLDSNYTINVAVADDATSTNVNRAIAVTRNNQFVVSTTADEDNGTADPAFGGGTSLREALRYAEASGGADSVSFLPALAGQVLTLSQGWNGAADDTALRITGDLALAGGGVTLKPAPGSNRRVFLSTAGTFTLSNMTVRDADVRGITEGGALWTNGTVSLTNVSFLANKATNGGAVMNFGNVSITNSTFSGNLASSEGGAIASGGTTTVNGATFSQNSAALGGAINSAGPLTVNGSVFSTNTSSFNGGALRLYNNANISNSTLSNNTAANGGGGLISHGTTTLTNVTIANNAALDGGGAQFFEGTATLRHVTIARNTATRDGSGTAVNFADVTITNTIISGNTGSDQNNTWGSAFNAASANNVLNLSATAAGLGTLASNGGATQTLLPLNGSPAIDAGAVIAGVTADQRGTARAQFHAPDIGAAEVTRADLNLPTVSTGGALWYVGPAALPNGDRRIYREVVGQAPVWVDSGAASRIDKSIDGTIVVQTLAGAVYIRPGSNAGTGSSWQQMLAIAGNDGQTWLLGPELNAPTERFIYRWPVAGALTSAGGAGSTLSNFNGTIWTQAGGSSWRYISDGNWQAVTAPLATSTTFDVATRQALVITFADEGRPFYSRASFSITNTTTSQTITAGTVAWNTTGNQATIDLTNALPEGNYVASLGATSLGSFYVLAGDANRDRTVNFDDLLLLAANYNQSGRNNAQGDANYDGNVNFDDLLALAANYNASLPAAGLAVSAPPPSATSGGNDGNDDDGDDDSLLA